VASGGPTRIGIPLRALLDLLNLMYPMSAQVPF
jgi:hypothetical protein